MNPQEELRVCPECGYERGFHVSFKKTTGKTRIALICPQCGQSYSIGWTTSVIKSFKLEKGLKY